MAKAIRHRGPDDEGIWMDVDAGVALVHRRLSILDLSQAGHQPMVSESGRYVLVYNGEIYNHGTLRAEFEQVSAARRWRGRSDTETLLALIEGKGIAAALKDCVGMFALAVWDRKQRKLILARDRMGEKPLYYGWQGKAFLFGSELAALTIHPAFERQLNALVMPLYLEMGYVPAPTSIWRGIFKLPPGTLVEIDPAAASAAVEPLPYWSLPEIFASGAQEQRFNGNPEQAINTLEATIGEAVAAQLESDVPLGAFLSGGVDSSLVVAMMQRRTSRAVRTFAIGFHEKRFDEAEHARAVAAHLGTDHAEHYLSTEDVRAIIPYLPTWFGEPFGDASALPTFFVSQLARQHVAVALSGDGGDELFGGYPHYAASAAQWDRTRWVPEPLRVLLGATLAQAGRVPPGLALGLSRSLRRAEGLGRMLAARDLVQFYRTRRAIWRRPSAVLTQDAALAHPFQAVALPRNGVATAAIFMALDASSYLPDAILAKVDRTAMAVSLETRAPLLDHRVVAVAARLPIDMKLRDGTNKWVLRQLLYRYVPKELVDRPKAGFSVPLNEWLRGPLRDWAESLLEVRSLAADGLFDAIAVQRLWQVFQSGHIDFGAQFWTLLAFLAWRDEVRTVSVDPTQLEIG